MTDRDYKELLADPPKRSAYLVLVTWADGTEGLLFPRPGQVAIAEMAAKMMQLQAEALQGRQQS